jgi:hypothetical protein
MMAKPDVIRGVRELVEQTLRADVSIASVALANGLNTNLLARWRRDHLTARTQLTAAVDVCATICIHTAPPSLVDDGFEFSEIFCGLVRSATRSHRLLCLVGKGASGNSYRWAWPL